MWNMPWNMSDRPGTHPPAGPAGAEDDLRATGAERPGQPPARPARGLSRRWAAVLAALMLGVGVAAGAAIGPAPDASLAGGVPGIAERLPLLLASLEAGHHGSQPAQSAASSPAPAPAAAEPAAVAAAAPAAAPAAPAAAAPAAPASEEAAPETKGSAAPARKLPAITNIWLIELDGTGFEAVQANKAAAPYITGQVLPSATLLGGWSAQQGSAFASEAAVAEPPAAGQQPPLLHSIVQPPCPEGAAGASCAPETPGQVSTADTFLKGALASITATPAYKEHGLVVITFADVGIAAQSELPAGASTAQLTYQPPTGVALLSPFARAGAQSLAYDPTSPRQSLEKLLH